MSTWFISYGFAEVYPGLVVGAVPRDGSDIETLAMMRIDRVLNLVEDEEYEYGERAEVQAAYHALGISETRLSLVDFGELPAERIDEAVTAITQGLESGERVYAHCRAGWQRSAAAAIATVSVLEDLTIADAFSYVQARKPTAAPLPHQMADLEDWWDARRRERAGRVD